MRIKSGVNLKGIRPEMAIDDIIESAFMESFTEDRAFWEKVMGDNETELYLTSAVRSRGVDEKFSFHHVGLAKDYDFNVDIPRRIGILIATNAKDRLGDQYECLWHKTKSGNYHLHVEFDPKEPRK